MKINLETLDHEQFVVRPESFGGETVYLVFPKSIAAKWDKHTLIFRSSVWNTAGEPVSLSFKKFFNWGEQPDLCYTPFSLTANGGCQVVEKIDGSTLIVSKYKGNTMIRTRGTVDASKIENGYEIELLKQKYPTCFTFPNKNGEEYETAPFSLIYEWVTPTNKIVINYNEPELYLIGAINHGDYRLWSQDELDVLSLILQVKRPTTYSFSSIKEMLEEVALFQGKEGVCCYCNNGQDIRKIKGEWYLKLHRMKEELGSFERVVDFYFANNCPTYDVMYQTIVETLDFEIAEQCQGDISRIVDGMKEVNQIVESMKTSVQPLKTVHRRDAAAEILQKWGNTNRSSMAFKLLDGKALNEDDNKKLLYQVLKK